MGMTPEQAIELISDQETPFDIQGVYSHFSSSDTVAEIAYHEQTIKDLNEVVYQQQQEIERIGSICDALVKRVKEFSELAPGIGAPANEKPPHY